LDNLTTIGGNLTFGVIWFGGNPALTSLQGLDNLISIGGNLTLHANAALTSLTGLGNVTSIERVSIDRNYALTSLTGLEGLTSIGSSLLISRNDILTSLTGLDNVHSIGGYLEIGANHNLTSISSLENVTSIGGYLKMWANNALHSLTGLDNIDEACITSLTIVQNSSLSTCEVQSICDYLASPSGTVEIHDNATGCNSQAEVDTACAHVWLPDISIEPEISIFPNPAKDILTISNTTGVSIEEAIIYNQTGQKVFEGKLLNNTIDVSDLQQGMYIVEIVGEGWSVREKLIVQ